MVEASLVPGVRAPDLALQQGIHVSLIYRWRRMARSRDKAQSSERDCRKFWGQAAIAIGGYGALAFRNFCPKPEPSVIL
jgi:transposase-like protein